MFHFITQLISTMHVKNYKQLLGQHGTARVTPSQNKELSTSLTIMKTCLRFCYTTGTGQITDDPRCTKFMSAIHVVMKSSA